MTSTRSSWAAPSPALPRLSNLDQFTAFAHLLADVAGRVILPYFESELLVESKADTTPVTKADREAEEAMRGLIEQEFPDHAIYGEEFGISLCEPQGELTDDKIQYTWVLDPIDGTKAFIAGRKEWGTLIAFCADGVPILGILNQPATGERWIGVRGKLTTLNGDIIETRPCVSLAEAELSTTSASYFTPEQAKRVVPLAQSVRKTVADGDCYAYGLLAKGARDIVLDAGLKPYDILALVPIVEGAGGTITAWDGQPITLAHFNTALAIGDSTLTVSLT